MEEHEWMFPFSFRLTHLSLIFISMNYPTSARCLTVAQELNGTTVDMKCCVAQEDGNVTLGQNSEEEFHVGEGK